MHETRETTHSTDLRAAECAAFSTVTAWLDACPIDLADAQRDAIHALILAENTVGAGQVTVSSSSEQIMVD